MKKYWTLLLFFPFLISSCIEDESEYSVQGKENVIIDQFESDSTNIDDELPEGQLVPGLHTVTLRVLQGLDSVNRQFKYYMPVSTNSSLPISLIFEFHGSYEFDSPTTVPNPLLDISESHYFNQQAIKENCIICYPAGWPEYQADSSGAVNWAGENYTRSLPFVDAMVKYFTEDNEPHVDPNRIYATGQSSGAIFSFNLALERPEVFAAITPRAGQSASTEPYPSRAVPVRVFAGERDETVIHSAVIENMTKWATEIGGYFASDMQMDTTTYEGYADVTIRYWHGGKADYEIYSLAGIGHGISSSLCWADMWEFMENHPLDNASTSLFITTDLKEINAQCGEPFEINLSFSQGAQIEMSTSPQGWNAVLDQANKKVSLQAPTDYFSNIDREGVITFTATLGDLTPITCEVSYYLNAPKSYFEVGDIYYNENFEPEGVVCWVNNSNIREAKIISLTGPGSYETMWYCGSGNGLGLNFDTPDREDGEGNTQKMVEYNQAQGLGFTSDDAAFMWANELGEGWYLPAIDELAAIAGNISKINEILPTVGGSVIGTSSTFDALYSSTTEVESGATTKTIYSYYFGSNQEIANQARTPGQEYFGFIAVRAFKKVTK